MDGLRTTPITVPRSNFHLKDKDSQGSPETVTNPRSRMQVDSQTTIFDQVLPVSAQINIKQEGSGEVEVVQVVSNDTQTGPELSAKPKNAKHVQAMQEFTSNDKDYVVLAKQIEKNQPAKHNLAKKSMQQQKMLTSQEGSGK